MVVRAIQERKMNELIGYVKSISFHLRWIFMSSERRYAYLWAKTKKQGDLGYISFGIQQRSRVNEVESASAVSEN
jgi:hypothetical protein